MKKKTDSPIVPPELEAVEVSSEPISDLDPKPSVEDQRIILSEYAALTDQAAEFTAVLKRIGGQKSALIQRLAELRAGDKRPIKFRGNVFSITHRTTKNDEPEGPGSTIWYLKQLGAGSVDDLG
jgi:ABC-type iron transport system FetAB ATPase subunit